MVFNIIVFKRVMIIFQIITVYTLITELTFNISTKYT